MVINIMWDSNKWRLKFYRSSTTIFLQLFLLCLLIHLRMNVDRLAESLRVSLILFFNVKENVIAQETSDAHPEFLMLVIVSHKSLLLKLQAEVLWDV